MVVQQSTCFMSAHTPLRDEKIRTHPTQQRVDSHMSLRKHSPNAPAQCDRSPSARPRSVSAAYLPLPTRGRAHFPNCARHQHDTAKTNTETTTTRERAAEAARRHQTTDHERSGSVRCHRQHTRVRQTIITSTACGHLSHRARERDSKS